MTSSELSVRERAGADDSWVVSTLRAACARVWAVTTNDNMLAIAFYRHVGMRLAAVHRQAVIAARQLKPEIPAVGENGIPIEDEWEFEMAEAAS